MQRMLKRIQIESEVFYDGLSRIKQVSLVSDVRAFIKNSSRFLLNASGLFSYRYASFKYREFKRFAAYLGRHFDAIIVVSTIPNAFYKNYLLIEELRQATQVPIINYSNYYLATRGRWAPYLSGIGGYNLERYDWYLSASAVSEYPLSQHEHPFSLIGLDLRTSSLRSAQEGSFKVLLDFEREGFEDERKIQVSVLEKLNIPYTLLKGKYSIEQMHEFYSTHNALFLSFRESFGFPIVEVQLCGGMIFLPYKRWAPSHYINKSVYDAGEGDLGSNFVVYDNDPGLLEESLLKVKENYDSARNMNNFINEYPQLYRGDLEQLKEFCRKMAEREITKDSHGSYAYLNSFISADNGEVQ